MTHGLGEVRCEPGIQLKLYLRRGRVQEMEIGVIFGADDLHP